MKKQVEKKSVPVDHVIVAPHPDDEIIGCFEIIQKYKTAIIYGSGVKDKKRREESMKLKELTNVSVQLFLDSIPAPFLNNKTTLYIPDPIYEVHPSHRKWGIIGESIAREGFDVVFYSVNMQAPYIHEVKNPNEKEELLQKVYPSQSDLWLYDKKYVLFEGRCRWLF